MQVDEVEDEMNVFQLIQLLFWLTSSSGQYIYIFIHILLISMDSAFPKKQTPAIRLNVFLTMQNQCFLLKRLKVVVLS